MSREAIANEKGVLPKLVSFDEEKNTLFEIIDTIKENYDESEWFSTLFDVSHVILKPNVLLYEDLEDKDITPEEFQELSENGLTPEELVYHYLWYVMSKEAGNKEDILTAIQQPVLQVVNSNKSRFSINKDVKEYTLDRVEEFKRDYDLYLRDFKRGISEREKPMQELKELPSQVEFRYKDILKSFQIFPVEVENDILEYFDKAKVSQQVPYVTCSPYSKLLQDAMFYKEWNVSNPDSLIGYAKWKEEESLSSYSQFELVDGTLTIESTGLPQGRSLEIIEKVQSCIDIKVDPNPSFEEISVEYHIENMDLHLWLFKQFLYTDPIMSKFFFIDESMMLQRKRGFITIYYYEDFLRRDLPPVVISIGNRKAGAVTKPLLSSDRCHIRVYLRRCKSDQIQPTLDALGKCLTKFNTQRDQIRNSLKLFPAPMVDQDYKEDCVRKRKEVEKLDYNDLFPKNVKGLLRKISPKPTVLEQVDDSYYLINPEDEPNEMKREEPDPSKPHALVFPSKREQDQMKAYYYTCNGLNKPFVGMSSTDTDQDFPKYVPSCFDVSQIQDKSSTLNEYLTGVEQEKEESVSSYVITKSKVLLYDQKGELLDYMIKWMDLNLPSHNLIRIGKFDYRNRDSPNYLDKELHHASILVLLHRLLKKDENMDITELKRSLVSYLTEKNSYLSDTYSYQREELIRIIQTNQFVDPRLFYHAICDLFNVTLFLLTKDEKKNGTPFYPCAPYYYSPMEQPIDETRSIMVVAINKGGEFDSFKYPICEAVYFEKRDDKSNRRLLLKPGRKMTDTFKKSFLNTLSELYGMQISQSRFRQMPIAQTLDSFGRVRWLHFQSVSLRLLVPIHSMDIPIRPDSDFTNTEQGVEQFLSQETGYRMSRNTGPEPGIIVLKDDMRCFIPVGRLEPDPSYVQYQRYEKVSRYLIEYTCLAFSLFIKEKRKVGREEFAVFYDQYMEMRNDHTYEPTKRKWNPPDRGYLTAENKVIVTSDVMKVKLMYLLKQKYILNPDALRGYFMLMYMPNYFSSLSDFSSQERTILSDRTVEREKMLEEGATHTQTVQQVQQGQQVQQEQQPRRTQKKPYIMYRKIEEFGHDVWLCYPTNSLGHAIWVADWWKTHQSIPLGVDSKDAPHIKLVWSSQTTYKLYSSGSVVETSRLVSVMRTETGIEYQALLPYRQL